MAQTIGIIGSRRRDTDEDYRLVLRDFLSIYQFGDRIVSGGCSKGGDRFAEHIANYFEIPIVIHYPNKSKLDPKLLEVNPRAAYAAINYDRNWLIAQDADILIACVAKDRKGGTEDTVKKFCRKFPKQGQRLTTEQELINQGRLVLV